MPQPVSEMSMRMKEPEMHRVPGWGAGRRGCETEVAVAEIARRPPFGIASLAFGTERFSSIWCSCTGVARDRGARPGRNLES